MLYLFDGRVRSLHIDRHSDERGVLAAVDFAAVDFKSVRSFVVEGVNGATRGRHGHQRCRQIWIRIAGQIALELRYGGATETLVLDEQMPALCIEPPVWGQQTYIGDGATLLVHCDQPYDPEDVLREPV
jgi:dTDP-4-dehydrorhamnose 3,5-epimerase-like enzyme